MGFCEHLRLMARYNQRMNQQLCGVCRQLPEPILSRDLGAFFKSIIGTLNHLLVADLLWLQRFSHHQPHYESLARIGRYPQPERLNTILYDNLDEWIAVRDELDALIIFWLDNEVSAADLKRLLTYANTRGIQSTRNFGELVSHMFNHQTHHRGQLTTLLSQCGADPGITDFLVDIPDKTRR